MVTANSVYYVEDRNFNQQEIRKIVYAKELNYIHLQHITLDFLLIGESFTGSPVDFSKSITFLNCNITQGFYIESSRILKGFFVSSIQNSGWIQIMNSIFERGLLFWHGKYEKGIFDIVKSEFKDAVKMTGSNFEIPFRIYSSTFDSTYSLKGSTFKSTFLIQDSKIYNLLLSNCTFEYKPKFNHISISDTLDLTNTSFENGIDLRRTDLSKTNAIFLENLDYPPGELTIYWEEVKGKQKPKISLKNLSEDKDDNYKRIEEIYKRLNKNYIAQGDNTSADQVMYELAWQKEIILGSFWQWLYGVSLGYGYSPIRYLIFPILVTIIVFWFIWYNFYYNIVAYILNKDLNTDLGLPQFSNVTFHFIKKKRIKIVDHSKTSPNINFITRLWHTLHFSASVLLGIRFKGRWIRIAKDYDTSNFLLIATSEWLLGKIYIILFIFYIKVHYFENWKSLLGL